MQLPDAVDSMRQQLEPAQERMRFSYEVGLSCEVGFWVFEAELLSR